MLVCIQCESQHDDGSPETTPVYCSKQCEKEFAALLTTIYIPCPTCGGITNATCLCEE